MQENIKNARKTLQTIQKTATDKENLVGRIPAYAVKETLALALPTHHQEELKHKKPSASTSSQTLPASQLISAEDLTGDTASEAYWETLAEKRRSALEETLKENEELHGKVEQLQDELNQSQKCLEEARALVEVLSEMLQDREENESNEAAENHVSVAEEASEEEESGPKSPRIIMLSPTLASPKKQ